MDTPSGLINQGQAETPEKDPGSSSPSDSWRRYLRTRDLALETAVRSQAQLGGHLLPRGPVEGQPAKSLQRGRVERLLQQCQQVPQDVPVVLLVPVAALGAVGGFELGEVVEERAAAGGGGAALALPPELAGTVTASISANALVTAGKSVSVTADLIDNPQGTAISTINSTNDTSKAYSGTISVVDFIDVNTASACIGQGATVNARDAINVTATTSEPFQSNFLDGILTGNGANVMSGLDEALSGNLGLANGFFSTWTQATDAGTNTAVAANVTSMSITNNTTACIADGAKINEDATTSNGVKTYTHHQGNADQTVTVHAHNETDTLNLAGGFGLGSLYKITGLGLSGSALGKFFGFGQATATPNDVGGSVLVLGYTNTVEAWIGTGALVYGASLTVQADQHNEAIGVADAGGLAAAVGANGLAGGFVLNDVTKAWIKPGSSIVVTGGVSVKADDNDPAKINLTGGISVASNVGIGLSVSVTNFTRDTEAILGSQASDGDAPAVGGVLAGGAIGVRASNEGVVAAGSLVGAVTTPVKGNPTAGTLAPQSLSKNYGIGISGDVSVNQIDDTTEAYAQDEVIEDESLVNVTGSAGVTVTATDTSSIFALAGVLSVAVTTSDRRKRASIHGRDCVYYPVCASSSSIDWRNSHAREGRQGHHHRTPTAASGRVQPLAL